MKVRDLLHFPSLVRVTSNPLIRPCLALFLFGLAATLPAAAHCDTVDGPVVTAARLALNSGDVTPVLKWVKPEQEAQIRDAFARAMKVRAQSPEARELADTYFFETLVRIHRAGEGEPYTVLKPAGTEVEPGIAMADAALAAGKIDELANAVSNEISDGIRHRYAVVQRLRPHADDNVTAGRQYVEAYVSFIHYMEQLYEMSAGPEKHGASSAAQKHPE